MAIIKNKQTNEQKNRKQARMKKLEPSYTVGGIENGTVTVKNHLAFPQKLNTELQHGPEILFLGIYQRNWNRCSN
jgi:hypothetical protein